jgi:hypothetical protein
MIHTEQLCMVSANDRKEQLITVLVAIGWPRSAPASKLGMGSDLAVRRWGLWTEPGPAGHRCVAHQGRPQVFNDRLAFVARGDLASVTRPEVARRLARGCGSQHETNGYLIGAGANYTRKLSSAFSNGDQSY